MSNQIDDAVAAHFTTLQGVAGVSATVTRGATTITPTIVLGAADSEAISRREAIISADRQDVMVAVADYGDLTEPQEGDLFTYEEAGQTVTAEARPTGATTKCFERWRGSAVFNIHLKITGRT